MLRSTKLIAALILVGLFSNLALADQKPLKIGVVLGLTGQAAQWSDMALKGITLAHEEAVKDGHEIRLIVEDSGTSPAGSVRAFNKLVHVDKVDAVLGNIWSFLNEPLVPIAKREGVLLLSVEVDCEAGQPTVFDGAVDLHGLIPAYKDFFRSNPDVKTMALVIFDDPGWGHVQRDAWRAAAKEFGVKEIGIVETAEYRPNFESIFPRFLSKDPDVIFVAHEPYLSTKALKRLRYKGKIVQSNALYEALLSGQGKTADFEGIFYADSDPTKEFAANFKKRFGLPPVLEPHKSYEMLRSVAKAFKTNSEDLSVGLRQVKYEGVSGPIDYTSNCNGNKTGWRLFTVRNGEPSPL